MALAEVPPAEFESEDSDPLMLWTTRAACKGQAELFFPVFGERPQARARRENQARAICATCPSREPCLWYGRLHHEYGIWGGENEIGRVLAGYGLLAPIGTRHLSRGRGRLGSGEAGHQAS